QAGIAGQFRRGSKDRQRVQGDDARRRGHWHAFLRHASAAAGVIAQGRGVALSEQAERRLDAPGLPADPARPDRLRIARGRDVHSVLVGVRPHPWGGVAEQAWVPQAEALRIAVPLDGQYWRYALRVVERETGEAEMLPRATGYPDRAQVQRSPVPPGGAHLGHSGFHLGEDDTDAGKAGYVRQVGGI